MWCQTLFCIPRATEGVFKKSVLNTNVDTFDEELIKHNYISKTSSFSPTVATVSTDNTFSRCNSRDETDVADKGILIGPIEIECTGSEDIPGIEPVNSFGFSPNNVSLGTEQPTLDPSTYLDPGTYNELESYLQTFQREGYTLINTPSASIQEICPEAQDVSSEIILSPGFWNESIKDSIEQEDRKNRIHNEIEDIVKECLNLFEYHVEDEAIEALGIAADILVQKKDSVAREIIKGKLLPLAGDHYYGSYNNFQVEYGPILLSTIHQMKSSSLLYGRKYYETDEYIYVGAQDQDFVKAQKEIQETIPGVFCDMSLASILVSLKGPALTTGENL